jgi:hypothetical protein
MGNYSRALGQGSAEIELPIVPNPDERLASYPPVGPPGAHARVYSAGLAADLKTQYDRQIAFRRAALRETIGDKVDELSTLESSATGYFTLFPNFHPWWAYDEITYRFRPYKDEPEMSVMETYLLRPFRGERPKPAPTRWLSVEESHMDIEEMGALAQIFNQDEYNIPQVQKGLHTMKAAGCGIALGVYQATKIRHFHKLWDKWIYGRD